MPLQSGAPGSDPGGGTPMLCPDRDAVEVFVFERSEGLRVTDLGEAPCSVFRMTGDDRRSSEQEQAIGAVPARLESPCTGRARSARERSG